MVEEKQSTKVEEPENSKYKSLGYLQELNPDKAKAIMKYHEEINSQIDVSPSTNPLRAHISNSFPSLNASKLETK